MIEFYGFNTDHEQKPSSLGSSLFSKKLEATYLGEQFVVINNWFTGLKIYHNGNLVGQSNQSVVRNKYEPFTSLTVVGKKTNCWWKYTAIRPYLVSNSISK